jgi:RNA polymerase sigma-70 factor (ECF subfamily)
VVLLEDQDRSRWDSDEIGEGRELVERALRRRRPGPYQIQAAIAALHASASRAVETDWRRIAALYADLSRRTRSPVVELNRAVAVAMADGPERGLEIVERLHTSGELEGYRLLHATRADLLRRLGRADEAAGAYEQAPAQTSNRTEREFLERRLAEVRRAE